MKSYFVRLTLLAAVVTLLGPTATWAQQKIALIDLDEAFNQLDQTKQGHKRVQEDKEAFQDEIDTMKAELKALREEHSQIAEEALSTALSEEIRKERREEGELKAVEISEYRSKMNKLFKEREKQLSQKILRLRKDIIEIIVDAAGDYARDEGYSMVIDTSAQSINQVPVVIYSEPRDNITEAVVDIINNGS